MCKSTHQLRAGVHGQKDGAVSVLAVSSNLEKMQSRPNHALGVADSSLDDVTLAGIVFCLLFDAGMPSGGQ